MRLVPGPSREMVVNTLRVRDNQAKTVRRGVTVSEKHKVQMSNARLEAFSDGVFSIAITLLALDLKVPRDDAGTSGETLRAALLNQWPAYVAFLTSFFSILTLWVHHHA